MAAEVRVCRLLVSDRVTHPCTDTIVGNFMEGMRVDTAGNLNEVWQYTGPVRRTWSTAAAPTLRSTVFPTQQFGQILPGVPRGCGQIAGTSESNGIALRGPIAW